MCGEMPAGSISSRSPSVAIYASENCNVRQLIIIGRIFLFDEIADFAILLSVKWNINVQSNPLDTSHHNGSGFGQSYLIA